MKPQLIKLPTIETAVRKDTIDKVKVSKNLQDEWNFYVYYVGQEIAQTIPLGKLSEANAKALLNAFLEEYNR